LPAATVVGGKVFFAGGATATRSGGSFIPSNVVDIYDMAAGTWSTATLSQARFGLAAATVRNEAFFAGGNDNAGHYFATVDIYDATAGTWSTASLSQPRENLAAAVAGNKVLFAGGDFYYAGSHQESNVVDVYDSTANSWSTATLSVSRSAIGAVSVGDTAIFAGGWTTAASNVVDIYNAGSNTWSTSPLSQPRDGLRGASAGGKAYFAGASDSAGQDSSTIDIYDPTANSWSSASLPQARGDLAMASANSKVFFAGGMDNWVGACSNTVTIYDTATQQWSSGALSKARYNLSAVAAGNKVFFAGGVDSGANVSSVVDIYTFQSYPFITSSKSFTLVDNTTVTGRMQLNGGSLGLATYSLNVGSMSGSAPINLSNQTLTAGSDGTNSTYAGILSGGGSLTKTGSGVLDLAGSNTYSGRTTVIQGTLTVDGWLTNSAVTVQGGGSLSGTGSLTSVVVNAGGHLAPGDALPGTLTLTGSLGLLSGSYCDFELGSDAAYDKIAMPGQLLTLNLQQFSDFDFTPAAGFGPGNYTLIDAGSVSGSLGSIRSGTIDGLPATLSIDPVQHDLVLSVTPEPSTLALLAASAIGLLGYGCRRRATRRTAKPTAFDQQDEPPILVFPSYSSAASAGRRAA
jgi:autotransporter-associated beta strand protein